MQGSSAQNNIDDNGENSANDFQKFQTPNEELYGPGTPQQ